MNVELKRKLENIIVSTHKESRLIAKKIPQQYVDIYCFIQERYESLKEKVAVDSLFKFAFRSYYMIRINVDQAEPYFRVLGNFTLRDEDDFDEKVREVLNKLKLRTDKKTGNYKIEYSYGSKLLHTVNTKYPIYDSQVSNALRLKSPYRKLPTREQKVELFLSVYRILKEYYDYIVENNLLEGVIKELEVSLDLSRLSYKANPVKLLDFIFWAKGK